MRNRRVHKGTQKDQKNPKEPVREMSHTRTPTSDNDNHHANDNDKTKDTNNTTSKKHHNITASLQNGLAECA